MFSKTKKLSLIALALAMLANIAWAAEPAKGEDTNAGPGIQPDAVFGPDAFGYQGFDDAEPECTFDFVDISATGATVASGDDVISAAIPVAGGFDLYGVLYNNLYVSTNGVISNANDFAADFSNDCPIPAPPSAGSGARIYPMHDDLITNNLLFEYFADCPRDSGAQGGSGEGCYVFQWNEATYFSGGLSAGLNQAILYEDSYAMAFQHGVGDTQNGSSSTTGIQNSTATDGLLYACNTPDSIPANSAQCIFHPDNPALGTQPLARFEVQKLYDDGNTEPVDVTITCNTGLPLQQSTTIGTGLGEIVTFVVTDFVEGNLDCSIFEDPVPEGYAVTYFPEYEPDPDATSCDFEGVVWGGYHQCGIWNALQPVEVEVTKWWLDDNPEFNAINFASANYSCANEWGDTYGSLDFLGDGDVESFYVYPHYNGTTTCTVVETVVEGGVEFDDSECYQMSVTPGNGASCNIYNTRLYEGIPTLSQYGLALLALLMLGIGFVAFRRVA